MNAIELGIYLARPTIELKSEYLSFYQEWKESGEVMIPFTINKDPKDFKLMLDYLDDCEKGLEPWEDWIPENTTYWLVDNQEIIGVVNIRHRLTKRLYNSGGYIGYGIRPSKRKKGYGTKILALSLEKAKELGIQRALLVCNAHNVASAKAIIKNRGIPDNDFIDEEGNRLKRFWIEI